MLKKITFIILSFFSITHCYNDYSIKNIKTLCKTNNFYQEALQTLESFGYEKFLHHLQKTLPNQYDMISGPNNIIHELLFILALENISLEERNPFLQGIINIDEDDREDIREDLESLLGYYYQYHELMQVLNCNSLIELLEYEIKHNTQEIDIFALLYFITTEKLLYFVSQDNSLINQKKYMKLFKPLKPCKRALSSIDLSDLDLSTFFNNYYE